MIVIDRSLPRSLADALTALRADVRWLEEEFPTTTPDERWLREAGRRGWLVISRDKHIRSRRGEVRAIREASVGCFILTQSGNMTSAQCIELVTKALDRMEELFRCTERPFIYAVRRDGSCHRITLR